MTRILVVEDEVLIALELECLLDDLGHTTIGVAASSAGCRRATG